MIPLSELFEITYGNKFDLNKLKQCRDGNGFAFVSRSGKNNGVSAFVEPLDGVPPYPAGLITVALGGSILSAFIQPFPFYTAQNVAVLKPRTKLDDGVAWFFCMAIHANRFRYSTFGREANRTLKHLLVPSLAELPGWLPGVDLEALCNRTFFYGSKANCEPVGSESWTPFLLTDLFTLEKGRGPSLKDAHGSPGEIPYVTTTDKNNGTAAWTSVSAEHEGGTISVAADGSVGETFYQALPFCSSTAVTVLRPRFDMSREIALFLCTIIRLEGKTRFSYVRKWGVERMKDSTIRLPVDAEGRPAWTQMEESMKAYAT